MKKYSNAQGVVIDYDAQLALSPIKGNPFDAENFYPADGFYDEILSTEEKSNFYKVGDKVGRECLCPPSYGTNIWMSQCCNKTGSGFNGENMSNAGGLRSWMDRYQKRRDTSSQSKADARQARTQAKLESAKGQRAAGESLGKESQSDVALAQALATKPASSKSTGMSTTTKVLIGVGVLAVVGLGAYMIMKKK